MQEILTTINVQTFVFNDLITKDKILYIFENPVKKTSFVEREKLIS